MVRWAVVVALALAVALVLTALILQEPQAGTAGGGAQPPPADLVEGTSARQAFAAALEVAQGWQSDARPATVSGHWRPLRGGWSGRVVWSFQFYSPSTRRLAVVIVEGGRASLLREARTPYTVPTFDPADWRVDSPAAVESWWEAGGDRFFSLRREVDLVAQLRAAEGGTLRWTVTGVAGDQVWTVVLDGVTGERVQE